MPSLQEYELELLEKAKLLRSLAHPARLAILKEIALKGVCIEGEIVEIEQISSLTIQQHLREMKKAGVIKGRIFGQSAKYCINWERLDELSDFMGKYIEELKDGNPSGSPC